MPIRTGTLWGPHEITPAIGTREMGEVYRAVGAPDNRNCWHASTSFVTPEENPS